MPVEAFNATYTQASDGTASRASLGAVTKGGGRREWFLQPGKLAVHHIGSALTYTYVGRLVDDAGSPLSNATILNAEYGQTNDAGRFAADFKRRPEKLHLFARDRLHVCDIESLMKESVVRVGTTTCLPSGIADLPEELREHRQVRRMAANLSADVGETKTTGDSL